MPKSIVILASGTGTLTSSIIEQGINGHITAVISDKRNSEVLQRAHASGIATYVISMKTDREIWNQDLFALVEKLNPDLVVSAGFMRILAPEFVKRFKVINSHPSLLPKFPGSHAVRDALLAGEDRTGCTIHWVDEGLDSGPVISQVEISINAGDSEAALHERIKIVERKLIVTTINWILGELDEQ